jgi:hypothetical protein
MMTSMSSNFTSFSRIYERIRCPSQPEMKAKKCALRRLIFQTESLPRADEPEGHHTEALSSLAGAIKGRHRRAPPFKLP